MRRDLLNDDDFFDKEINDFLQAYVPKPCDEDKIDETIDVLKDYMPKKKNKYALLTMIKNQVTYVNRGYIAFSIIFMILGIILSSRCQVSAYDTLLIFSPFPVIIGIYEIAKSKTQNMWEIEKSYKYSYSLVFLSRMIIVTIISSFSNMFFSLSLCNFDIGDMFVRCMSAWIVPMTIVFSISLVIFSRISRVYAPLGACSIWIITLAFCNRWIVSFLQNAREGLLILIMAFSISVFILSFIKFYKVEKNYEGEALWN